MREYHKFGEHVGRTIFYNDIIISIEEVDMRRLGYICYFANYNESYFLDHLFVNNLLDLQDKIKHLKDKKERY